MSVFGGSDLGDPDDAHLQGFAYDRFELPGRYSLALSDGEEDADFLGTGLGGLANLDRMSAAAGMDLDTVSDGGGDWLRADLASLQQYQELLQDGGDRHRRSSTAAAVCNYVLGTVGIGMLALPSAYKHGGWFTALMTLLVGLTSSFTAKLLIQAMAMCRPGINQYPDIALEAYGPRMARLVAVLNRITLFGVCSIMFILIGRQMTMMVDDLSFHEWILVFAAILIPISWIKRYREMSPLSVLGVAALTLVLFCVTVFGFHRATKHEEIRETYVWFDLDGVSTAFTIVTFSFAGHSVIPAIASQLRNPRRYRRFVHWSYGVITLCYLLIGCAGYSGWGATSADNILFSLCPDMVCEHGDKLLMYVCLSAITARAVCAYPIPMLPLNMALEARLRLNDSSAGPTKQHSRRRMLSRALLRSATVLATVLTAAAFPYFGELLSLVSSVSVVCQVFIFPCLFWTRLARNLGHQAPGVGKRLLMLLAVAVGIAGTISGTYFSFKDLVKAIDRCGNPFSRGFDCS